LLVIHHLDGQEIPGVAPRFLVAAGENPAEIEVRECRAEHVGRQLVHPGVVAIDVPTEVVDNRSASLADALLGN
jgi:hypothetical protein